MMAMTILSVSQLQAAWCDVLICTSKYEIFLFSFLSLSLPPPPPSFFYNAGEKPFETIEDLVQDGLITLHMEANNVEEYLRSARETRVSHSASVGGADQPNLEPIQETAPLDQPVFLEDEAAESSSAKSSRDCMPRKPPYYPCTIPQRHSSINSPPLPELSKEESKRLLMKGYVPPHTHSQHTLNNGTVDIVTPVSYYELIQ